MMDIPMTNEIWVFGDLRHERLFRFSLNVLAKARALSGCINGKAVMVFLSAPDDGAPSDKDAGTVSLESAINGSFSKGADRVCVLENDQFEDSLVIFLRKPWRMVKQQNPMLVLFALTDFGREMASRTARICGAGLMADCVDLQIADNRIAGLCPAWGGEIMAEITYARRPRYGICHGAPQIQTRMKWCRGRVL
jgi:electron transfer flavoprotein alpha subunit